MTVSERVFQSLRQRIVTNELLPGQRISENEIAREYRVSRTPVREALRRLEQGRFVVRSSGGTGYRIRPLDLSEMDEAYETRQALEELSLRSIARHLSPDLAKRLLQMGRQFPDEGPPGDVLAADERFHLELAAAAKNQILLEFLEIVAERIHIIRRIDFTIRRRCAVTKAEHLEILTTLISGDTGEAVALMRAHIKRSKEVCELLAGEGLAMVFNPPNREGPGRAIE